MYLDDYVDNRHKNKEMLQTGRDIGCDIVVEDLHILSANLDFCGDTLNNGVGNVDEGLACCGDRVVSG